MYTITHISHIVSLGYTCILGLSTTEINSRIQKVGNIDVGPLGLVLHYHGRLPSLFVSGVTDYL